MKHSAVAALLCTGILALPPTGQAEDFCTPEYNASTGLELVHAADAYTAGYTGKGITLGIFDTPVNGEHPELEGKVTEYPAWSEPIFSGNPGEYEPDFYGDTHGSHVGGIMAAKKDGQGMHGLAFDANLFSLPHLGCSFDGVTINKNAKELCLARPDVRVFNNSWGSNIWSLPEGRQKQLDFILNFGSPNDLVYELSAKHDKLMVFAAGNESTQTPTAPVILPYLDRKLGGWLSVINMDSREIHIADPDTGQLEMTQNVINPTSCLARHAELFSVSAPGTYIYSLNAAADEEEGFYCFMSGTSQAAPLVTATAGLVQQSFPWMSNKQLADCILTTANNNFTAPEYILQYEFGRVRVTYINDSGYAPTLPEQELLAVINNMITDTLPKDFPMCRIKKFMLDAVEKGRIDYTAMSREEVFGQGILDAGKAVLGIGRLDANRMYAADVRHIALLGENHALETFDTKGFNAVFSNDITQRVWQDRYHHPDFQLAGALNEDALALNDAGIHIGLLKTGKGLLTLSGTNSYHGATVIEGGALSVSHRKDGSGGLLENSTVIVGEAGTLQGNGTIQQKVYNAGLVAPGNSIGTLTIGGYKELEQGRVCLEFNNKGEHDRLIIGGEVPDKVSVLFDPLDTFYGNGFSIELKDLITHTSGMPVSVNSDNVSLASRTLVLGLTPSGDDYALRLYRPDNAYSQWVDNGSAQRMAAVLPQMAQYITGDMERLYGRLDSCMDTDTLRRAMTQLSAPIYDKITRDALDRQSELNALILARSLDSALPAGTTQIWAAPYGSWTHDHAYDGAGDWSSNGTGLTGGVNRSFSEEWSGALHLAAIRQDMKLHGDAPAEADSHALYAGASLRYAPSALNGGYMLGQVCIGMEYNEVQRSVLIGDYVRQNESDWHSLSGSLLLGGGKNWQYGEFSFGPLGWLEYNLNHRPAVNEDSGKATRLHFAAKDFDSMQSVLGVHLHCDTMLNDDLNLYFSLLTAWRHELLDDALESRASFRDYAPDFLTHGRLAGRDSMLMQGSVRLTRDKRFFAECKAGGEFFRKKHRSFNTSLNFGWNF